MDPEEIGNIGLICPEHASISGKFKGQDPSLFIGKYVKLGFPTKNGILEHMWVYVEGLAEGEYQLSGTLDNSPVLECEFSFNDLIQFNVDEIEDIYGN